MHLILKMVRVVMLLFIVLTTNIPSIYGQSLINSLEQVAKNAKPGWDQIDMAVGLELLFNI